MKRIFLVTTLLFLGFFSAQAQFTVGLKAGLNYANITGKLGTTPEYDRDRKLGFNAGFIANFEATNILSVQPEILYSTKGYKVEDSQTKDDLTTDITVNSKFNYIDLPVMVQVHSGQFYVEAGPQVSFLVNQETKTREVITRTRTNLIGGTQEEEVSDKTTTAKQKDLFKSPEMGYGVGLGFKSPSKATSFGIRYSQNLGGMLKDSKNDAKNSLVQLSITSNIPAFGRK